MLSLGVGLLSQTNYLISFWVVVDWRLFWIGIRINDNHFLYNAENKYYGGKDYQI